MLDAAGKRQLTPARGYTKLTSRRRNTPARAREEAQRVERPLAELHLVKEDERALAVEWDALVLCDTPHDGIDVVSRTVEERGDKIEVGLKVELHELVPGHTPSNRLDHIGLADAARATLEALDDTTWTAEAIDGALEPLPEALDLKKRVVFQAVRVAVCGNMVSPPLGETMALVGREDCLARIDRARGMAL